MDFVGYFFNESSNETKTKKRAAKINLSVFSVIAMSFFATMKAAVIIIAPIIITGEVLKRETNILTATFIQKSK
jgi:hypothetical protein